jgi:hypothetical protein
LATALVTELSGRARERCTSSSRIALSSLRLRIAVVDHRAGERLVEHLHARDVVEGEPEHVAGQADRERRRELLDELAAARGREPLEQRIDVARDRLGEALAHGPHAEGLVERPALACVLVAVAREHHHAERCAHQVRLRPDGELVPAE